MALSRKKVARQIKGPINAGSVIDLPPGWVFELKNERNSVTRFDFRPLRSRGRDNLAGHMRDAVWSQRHECTITTLKTHMSALTAFWRFLDEMAVRPEPITRLEHIDRALLNLFVGWINLQLVADVSKRSYGQPLTISARSSLYHGIKAILINRQRRVPDEVCPTLGFPRNPFPNRNGSTRKREPYSPAEHKRILNALNQDLRAIHNPDADPLPPSQVLAVHLVALATVTGRNLQPLLELRRDSLQKHPLPERELLVTHKRRGYSTHSTSVRKAPVEDRIEPTMSAVPASVGDHFRHLCAYTAPLAEEADAIAEYVFLWRHTKYANKGAVAVLDCANAFNAIKQFARRHGLLDDSGRPLALGVARLRPTFAADLYRRTGDVRRVQQALGHASARTTTRNYLGVLPESERNHAFVLEAMVGRFARIEIEGKVLLAADGKIPLEGVKDLLAGGYSTGIARCKNPFRDEDAVCKKFFSCFKCPSMLVFEDDLWRLFSFYYRLLSERAKIAPNHWLKTYGPIIRRIDVDIASQFPAETVQAARSRAKESPHPAWR